MIGMRALAAVTLCLNLPFMATAASAQGLTPAQYNLIMEGTEVGQSGYERLTTRHKALAACVRWPELRSGKPPDFPVRSFGGDSLAQCKREALELCAELEKQHKCKCRLVDVDGSRVR